MGHVMPKYVIDEWIEWMEDWQKNEKPLGIRMGQSFVNHYKDELELPLPYLFYSTDESFCADETQKMLYELREGQC